MGIQPGNSRQARKWTKQRYQVWPSQGQSWAASKPKAGHLSVTGNQEPGKRLQGRKRPKIMVLWELRPWGPVASWPCTAPGQPILGLGPWKIWRLRHREWPQRERWTAVRNTSGFLAEEEPNTMKAWGELLSSPPIYPEGKGDFSFSSWSWTWIVPTYWSYTKQERKDVFLLFDIISISRALGSLNREWQTQGKLGPGNILGHR